MMYWTMFELFYCVFRVSDLLDYTAEELTGKNLYALCHGEDANKLRKCHVDCEYTFYLNSFMKTTIRLVFSVFPIVVIAIHSVNSQIRKRISHLETINLNRSIR